MSQLNTRFDFRIDSKTKMEFIKKAELVNKDAPALMREFIQAFIDSRLTIDVDEETFNQTQGLYNVTRK